MPEVLETLLAGLAAELGATLADFELSTPLTGFATTDTLVAGFAETLGVLLVGFATTGTGILGTTRTTSAPVLAAAKGSIGFSAAPFVERCGALLAARTLGTPLAELAAALPVGFGFAAAPAAGLSIPTLADGAPGVWPSCDKSVMLCGGKESPALATCEASLGVTTGE